MEQDKEYYVFISYKSEDEVWAVWLQNELERYHLPATLNGRSDIRQNLREVFRDIDELSAGNLPKQIITALQNSTNLIVVCSPRSAKSKWVNDEIKAFIAMGKTDHIFPFIIEGNSPTKYYPPALLNLPKSEELLGGDAPKHGRDRAFVKIVSGMLGLGFSTLWNRYEIEKAKQEQIELERKNNLLRIQSRFISEKAISLSNKGKQQLALRLLLAVTPENMEAPDRPFVPELEAAYRTIIQNEEIIIPTTAKYYYIYIERVVSSPNNQYIITESSFKIEIYEVNTGRLIRTIKKAFLEERQKALQAEQIKTASTVWDINNDGCIYSLLEADKKHNTTKDNKYYAELTENGKQIKIYDNISRECIKTINIITEHNYLCFSPDSHFIAALSYDEIEIWDFEEILSQEGKVLESWYCSAYYYKIHDENYSISAFSFSNDSNNIIFTIGPTIHIKELKDENTLPHSSYFLTFSPDGKLLLSLSYKSVFIFDIETSACVGKIFCKGDTFVDAGFLVREGHLIVGTASMNGDLCLWNYETGECLKKVEKQYSYNRRNYVLSSDNTTLAYIDTKRSKSRKGDQKIIKIIDKKTNECLKELTGHTDTVNRVDYSPDGKRLASVSDDGTIKIWDIVNGTCINTIEQSYGIHSVSFSKDGKYFVTTSEDGYVYVWDSSTFNLITTYKDNRFSLEYATFSPDGKTIVAVENDNGNGDIYLYRFPPISELIDQTRERFKAYPLTPEERKQYHIE